MSIRTAILLLSLTLPALVSGASIGPCAGGVAKEGVLAISSSTTTYCVSDYGWTDTWLVGSGPQNQYLDSLDVFSGDAAAFVHYRANGGAGAGNGFLTPSLDQGSFIPQPERSNWTVANSISYLGMGASVARSTLLQTVDNLVIEITTSIVNSQVTQVYKVTNAGPSMISAFQMGYYFNFHPNGTFSTDSADQGVTTYNASTGAIEVAGDPGRDDFLENGRMSGDAPVSHYAVGIVSNVLDMARNNTLDDGAISSGRGDTAGALQWNLGDIAAGESRTVTITNRLVRGGGFEDVPEPSQWVMLVSGAGFLGWLRGRRRSRAL